MSDTATMTSIEDADKESEKLGSQGGTLYDGFLSKLLTQSKNAINRDNAIL